MPRATAIAAAPSDLVTSLRTGRVHVFVGSGVSASAGVTGWDDLIAAMVSTIRSENTTFTPADLDRFLGSADHLDVAELFRKTVGAHAYFRFLRERYRQETRLSPLLKAIARLPCSTIFTTNYDKLLEAAFRGAGTMDPAVVIYPEQLNYIEDNEIRIVKLHGDIDHPSSLVLTRSDYAAYAARHADFIQQLQMSINGFTVLFIGFGLRDPNFRRIFTDARSFYESTNRKAYAIMSGTNAVERDLWDREGLAILPVAQHRQVPSRLKQLGALVSP